MAFNKILYHATPIQMAAKIIITRRKKVSIAGLDINIQIDVAE